MWTAATTVAVWSRGLAHRPSELIHAGCTQKNEWAEGLFKSLKPDTAWSPPPTGIQIFPNLLCVRRHWLNVTLKASSSDPRSPIFSREFHKSRTRQDLWRMLNRLVQPVIRSRPEATCCAIAFKRSCAVSWQESTAHRSFWCVWC